MDSKTLNSLSGYPDKGVEFRWRCLVSQESRPFKRTSGRERSVNRIDVRIPYRELNKRACGGDAYDYRTEG
jgi:hypothetical protein